MLPTRKHLLFQSNSVFLQILTTLGGGNMGRLV